MSDPNDQSQEAAALGTLAREVLIDLYRALSGHTPKAVRVYGEDDALLLLLRFDPNHLTDTGEPGSPLSEAALMAMPDMLASAVRAHTNKRHRLIPGSLTISSDRSFVSLGFSVVLNTDVEADEPVRSDDDDDWPHPRLALVS
jgi:hypothetical protein